MSTVPNAYGTALSTPPPYLSAYSAIATPYGTYVRPGGRVAAYVRSTGAQEGDDYFASSGNLVTSINEGLKRCRSGQNDVVVWMLGWYIAVDSSMPAETIGMLQLTAMDKKKSAVRFSFERPSQQAIVSYTTHWSS